jgi:hypothetical protein
VDRVCRFAACQYDDEPGSPWTLVLDGPDEVGEIPLGRIGGRHVFELAWVRKPSAVVVLRRASERKRR